MAGRCRDARAHTRGFAPELAYSASRNKRVAVIDADTGRMKRFWSAYGNKPDDTNHTSAPPAQQFPQSVHCIERSNDGLVYVCDRANDRLQVFKPDGTFVKEAYYAKNTRGAGSVLRTPYSAVTVNHPFAK